MHCLQVKAGAGTVDCTFKVSSQSNAPTVFVWDDSGEFYLSVTTIGPAVEFEMPVEQFGRHFTVQVGQRTTPVVLYGELCFTD